MLTILAWFVFMPTTIINFIIFPLYLVESHFLTKNDWYFITISMISWIASTIYLFGFF